MDHDPHIGFIVAAYLVAAVVIASMILVIVTDHQALKRGLRRFGPPRKGSRE